MLWSERSLVENLLNTSKRIDKDLNEFNKFVDTKLKLQNRIWRASLLLMILSIIWYLAAGIRLYIKATANG